MSPDVYNAKKIVNGTNGYKSVPLTILPREAPTRALLVLRPGCGPIWGAGQCPCGWPIRAGIEGGQLFIQINAKARLVIGIKVAIAHLRTARKDVVDGLTKA